MTRLFIWRHGQTGWNNAHRIQGQTDVPINTVGHVQAAAAAAALAAEHPDLIVSSDLLRATETAAPLAAATGLSVTRDPRLRERYFGEWQGMTDDEVAAAHPAEFARWRRGEPVGACGVEDLDDLAKRVVTAVGDVVSSLDGGTAVIVTHGGAAKYALGELLDWPREVTARVMGLANCHWSELRHDAVRGWLLRAHNVGCLVD